MGSASSKLGGLLKAYAIFALFHSSYKLFRALYERYRFMNLLKDVPGEKGAFGVELVKNMHRLHEWRLENFLKHLGSPLMTTAGPGNRVLLCDRDSLKFMLKDGFNECTKPSPSQQPALYFFEKFVGGKGIFVLRHGKGFNSKLDRENQLWYNQRKLASLVFTKRNFASFMHSEFVKKLNTMTRVIEKHAKTGDYVDMQNLFFNFTMNSIQKIFFNEDVDTLEEGVDAFGEAFDNAHRLMMRCTAISMLPILLSLNLLPWPFGTINDDVDSSLVVKLSRANATDRAFRQEMDFIYKKLDEYIEKAREDVNLDKRKDLLSAFLRDSSSKADDEYLRHLILNFTIAGRDTTACTLSWLFYELAIHPDIQECLYREIAEKLPNKKVPLLEDLEPQNMPYLNGCIIEALRLHPPVPEDTKITTADVIFPSGVCIPKGTTLDFSPYCMGRDPKRYKNPEEFCPTRWIPYTGYPDTYDFPVFQAGYRECLGKEMALFESKLVTAILLQRFAFSLRSGEKEKITYSLMITASITNSGTEGKLQDSATYNLWLKPTLRSN